MSSRVDLTDEEVKTTIAILRFAYNACPIENIPEHEIERDTVKNLISKFEEVMSLK
jgi:hypothetical protein